MRDLGYEERDIILVGRSMGSGPATEMATTFTSVAALILISPFLSLKAATKSFLGSIASLLVRERFDNLEAIQKVQC